MAENRQHLVHLHSSSKPATLTDLKNKNFQVGELAMYNAAQASGVTLYAVNSGNTGLAEFKTDAYYQNAIKNAVEGLGDVISEQFLLIGETGDTSGDISYYGVKKYAESYTNSKINALDATLSAATGTVITGITQTDGKVVSATTAPLTFKKTEGEAGDTYVLSLGGVQIGDTITTYKDSSLDNVELSGQTLIFTYNLQNGTQKTQEVNLSNFLTEVEAQSLAGAGLTANGTVLNIVKATDSETFLQIGENNIAIKGVQDAIDKAYTGATSYTQTNYTPKGTTADTSATTSYYGARKYAEAQVSAHNSANISVTSGASNYVTVNATTTGHSMTFVVKDTISDNFAVKGHKHVASDITGGTFDIARIPTGTSSTTVARGNHTHAYIATTQSLQVDLKGDVTGLATSAVTGGTISIQTTLAGDAKTDLDSKLSSVSVQMKEGSDNGIVNKTYTVTTAATTFNLSLLSIDCGEY